MWFIVKCLSGAKAGPLSGAAAADVCIACGGSGAALAGKRGSLQLAGASAPKGSTPVI